MRSRYGDRHSKRKQNIVLNSLIGIVLAVILVLVANIVFTGNDSQQTASEEQPPAQTSSDEKSNKSSDDSITSDEADSKDSESNDSDSDSNANQDSSKDESTDEEKEKEENEKEENDKEKEDKEDQDKEEADQEPGEPNLEGPWEPVGTVQSGPHKSSYTKGTDDWNEKIKAAESVMGLSEDQMTIWRIGGNGGPQKSFARVSKAGSGNQVYYIELEWVDGEGWKPVSVKPE
ncbi:DUF1510 family protein [Alkalihalobacillus hwajinpoensis]|uniref:DUF1510 family protein n=1 Tax=Guptibacillus hwajinpoensis TaxID=208199 RepID=UPI0018843612|nr:DUF1510 family protein [Pseudalkalibacillus hwajinpoensis]MBF0706442.1 DUF1510 family protein [Pseudalkalibacillus hwajinpoensis]